MTLLTATQVTNKYLYKKDNVPNGKERLNAESIINGIGESIKVNRNAFMDKETGPGRFVSAADFDFLGLFFEPDSDTSNQRWGSDAPLGKLAPGEYSKKQILTMLGYYNSEGKGVKSATVTKTLGFYDDGKDDLLERAYIWNTTAFKLTDNKDLTFVVGKNGERYIKNFAIEPYKDENFDFEGGFWSNLVNKRLTQEIDPSGIGKQVKLEFIGEIKTKAKFTKEDFIKEKNRKDYFSLLNGAAIALKLDKLIETLWNNGSIKHLYQGKPIIYGSSKGDNLVGTTTRTGLSLNSHKLKSYIKNGIAYATGDGDDKVKGTQYNDIIVSGTGDDILDGGKGKDVLEGGEGFDTYYADKEDTIIDSDGKGKVILDKKTLSGGERDAKKDPEGEYKSDDGLTYKWSGGDLSVNGVKIKNFQNGQLGIKLETKDDEEPEALPPAIDPLTIDMNGDGVKTLSRDKGVYFDLDNNKFAERTGWIDGNDAFLALDRNENNKIDNGTELFGTYTKLTNGDFARNGFEALAEFDSNHDNVLDEKDEIWSRLKLWQDRNSNGITDAGELTSIADSNLSSINLSYKKINQTDSQGNSHRNASHITRQDGSQAAVEEIWFDVSTADTKPLVKTQIPDHIKSLPYVRGFGNVPDLHTAMTLDSKLVGKVQEYIAAANDKKPDLLEELIYQWVGAKVKGSNPNWDKRKSATLDALTGINNPIFPFNQAKIIEEFERFKDYVAAKIAVQTTIYKDVFDSVMLQYNPLTQSVEYDWSQVDKLMRSLVAEKKYDEAESVAAIVKGLGAYSSTMKNNYVFRKGERDQNVTLKGIRTKDTFIGSDGDDILGEEPGYLGNDVFYGGKGNDKLNGGFGEDMFVFEKDWGQDIVTDHSGNNTLAFKDIKPQELTVRHVNGDMIVIRSGSEDKITVQNQFSGVTRHITRMTFSDGTAWDQDMINKMAVQGTDGDDVIEGVTKNDVIRAGGGNDTITGAGRLYGEAGNDILQAQRGTMHFIDRNSDVSDIENVEGMPVNILDGGSGNDMLYGSYDNEIYHFDVGFGQDDIYERREGEAYSNVADSFDVIRFSKGISVSDIEFVRRGNNLILQHRNNVDRITVHNYFKEPTNHYKINKIEFADGTHFTTEQFERKVTYYGSDKGENIFGYRNVSETIRGGAGNDYIDGREGDDRLFGGGGNDRLVGGAGNDILDGGAGDDHYYYYAGSGQDVIDQTGGGKDILFTNNVTADRLSFKREGQDLLVIVDKDKQQSVRVKNHFLGGEKAIWGVQPNGGYTITARDIAAKIKAQESGGLYDRVVEGTEGADSSLVGSNQNDLIKGFAGKDSLFGFGGNDRLEGGDGNDYLSGGDGRGKNSGNDILIGGNGDDTLYGEDGNDWLMGGAGNDRYLYHAKQGIDVIETGGGRDILFFQQISANRLSFHRSQNDLVALVDGDEKQQVRVRNHFLGGEHALAGIQPANSYTLTAKEINRKLTPLPKMSNETIRSVESMIQAMATFAHNNDKAVTPVYNSDVTATNPLLATSSYA